MKFSTYISIHSILLPIFGSGFLLAHALMLFIYGTSTDTTGLLTARVFGIGNIQLSIIMWTSRNDVGSKIIKILGWLLFLGNAFAFMLALQAQFSGVFNVLGWTSVALYLIFTFGYGYYQLVNKGDRDAK